jgi:Fe(3+) dicitrate transport protein
MTMAHIRMLVCIALTLATLSGHIVDITTGQSMPGIHVTLRGPTSSATRSNPQGRFLFRNLAPGHYTVTVESADVPRQTRSVEVRAGEPTTLDLHICSTTLDYQCGGGSPGSGSGA